MTGLANLGNTCGINTLLQCLAHSTYLFDVIQESTFPEGSMGDKLRQVLGALRKGDGACFVPKDFVKAVFDTSQGLFCYGDQHDISELYHWMMDQLHESSCTQQDDLPWMKMPSTSMNYMVTQTLHKYQKAKYSAMLSALQGSHISMVCCSSCKEKYTNIEPWISISLDVEPNTCKLQELLEHVFCQENIDHWVCDKCKSVGAQKITRWWNAPDTLVIFLKRFNGHMKKIHTIVEYTEWIAIQHPAVISKKEEISYRLRSVANHHGGYQDGHYTALTRKEETWQFCDDNSCTKLVDVDGMFTKNPSAYMLVYERVV